MIEISRKDNVRRSYFKRIDAALAMTNGVVLVTPASWNFRVLFAPPGQDPRKYFEQMLLDSRERLSDPGEVVVYLDETGYIDLLLDIQKYLLNNPEVPEKVAQWKAKAWLSRTRQEAHIG